MAEVKFTNELGSPISVSVVAEEAAPGVKGVNIQILGPTSLSENIITVQEAKVLQTLLNRHFTENP